MTPPGLWLGGFAWGTFTWILFKKTDAFCNSFRKATVQTIPYMSIQIVTDLH